MASSAGPPALIRGYRIGREWRTRGDATPPLLMYLGLGWLAVIAALPLVSSCDAPQGSDACCQSAAAMGSSAVPNRSRNGLWPSGGNSIRVSGTWRSWM